MFIICSYQWDKIMDWKQAIQRNSEALKAVVAVISAMLGDRAGLSPRSLHRAVLRLLFPAESALRRLIVVAARGLAVKLPAPRPMPAGLAIPGKGSGRVSFPLFESRKTPMVFRRGSGRRLIPRIHVFTPSAPLAGLWPAARSEALPSADDMVSADRLRARLEALGRALGDLPRQARRLARWRARREKMKGPALISPLRRGPPPGHRLFALHEVDFVLRECHGLAFDALKPDTS
jgi:hypothetical protein